MTYSERTALSRRALLIGAAALTPNWALGAPGGHTLDLHVTYGQSWGSNTFDSFASPFKFDPLPDLLLACRLPPNRRRPAPSPCPNSLGIQIPGVPNGVTGYSAAEAFSVGRIGVLSQENCRLREGRGAPTPILEMCFCYPGESWTSGAAGGLAPGASDFVASISGTTLTVTRAPASGVISPGQDLKGRGVHVATKIRAFGTGRGGVGTYELGLNLSSLNTTFVGAGPEARFSASIARGMMTVASVDDGSLSVGQQIVGGNLPPGTRISESVRVRDHESYALAFPQSVTDETMSSLGVSWAHQAIVLPQIVAGLPYGEFTAIDFKSVHYIQGSAADRTLAGKLSDLTEMLTAYDALKLPKSAPLKFYLSQAAAISTATSMNAGDIGTYQFCRDNAPGGSGRWAGRCFASTPWYQWPFNGADNIHTGDYGSARHGEFQGYVRWLVQDKGIAWTPLWRSLKRRIEIKGQTITVAFDRPAGPDFASKQMAWRSEPDDGVKVWPQYGFHVARNGAFMTLSRAPEISGMDVVLSVAEAISPGDAIEVSYAMQGPGGPNPGASSGVGGNLMMSGPASALFPNKSIDAWAWPFLEKVSV